MWFRFKKELNDIGNSPTASDHCCSWPARGRTRAQTERHIVPHAYRSRQSDPDAATRRSFEIGLGMIGAIVNVDPVELSAGNASKFEMPLIPTRQ